MFMKVKLLFINLYKKHTHFSCGIEWLRSRQNLKVNVVLSNALTFDLLTLKLKFFFSLKILISVLLHLSRHRDRITAYKRIEL